MASQNDFRLYLRPIQSSSRITNPTAEMQVALKASREDIVDPGLGAASGAGREGVIIVFGR